MSSALVPKAEVLVLALKQVHRSELQAIQMHPSGFENSFGKSISASVSDLMSCIQYRSLKPARDAAASLQRYRKQRMQSQAKAASSCPALRQDESATAVSGRDGQSNSGLQDTLEGGEADGKDPAQGSRAIDGMENCADSGARPADSNVLTDDNLARTHSMPGKVEGIATAMEASPLLESLDNMAASTSSK